MAKMDNIKFLSDIDAPSITVNGEKVATKPYVDNKVANIPTKTSQLTNDSGFITSSSESLELGYQLTATGEYSAAFNKGLIGSETKASILGYEIDVNDILTKGVDIVAVDTVNNTLDIYGTYEVKVLGFTVYTLTIADAFEYAMEADPKFIVEVANTHKLPVISSEKATVNGKEHARLHIHKSASVSDITTSQKVTNFYAGYVDARNSMVVNNLNVVLGEHSFASGSNNLNIGHSTHTQNSNNIASGEGGSAAGTQTEAGNTAFSTGHKTKALGESSFTFGIRGETAATQYDTEGNCTVEGGKGSIAGGYDTRANAPYSAAFGISTHADIQGQFVCGLANAVDTNALFVVGGGNNKNILSVDPYSSKFSSSLIVGTPDTSSTGNMGAIAAGNRTKANGQSSLTFGIGSETVETTSDNEGGKGSLAGGYESKCYAPYSAAVGFMTKAVIQGQFACGRYNDNVADALFVVGTGSSDSSRVNGFTVGINGDGKFAGDVYSRGVKLATLNDITNNSLISAGTGTNAIKMGTGTLAESNYSFAGGESSTTEANTKLGFAFGNNVKSTANSSTAFGWRTVANCENQLVVGRCNNYQNWGDALFVVGNGTSETDRRNAFVVHGNGNVYITGNAYAGNKQLATQEWVNEQLNILANTLKKLNDGGIE